MRRDDNQTAAAAAGTGAPHWSLNPNSRKAVSRARTGLSVAVALTLAACAGNQDVSSGKIDKKYGVAASPRVVKEGEEVPRGGGRYVVGKSYKVAGKTYHPREDKGYERTGLASWYGKAFHGRLTANGEVFDMDRLTGAHTTMPLPSYARVTNTKNGRSVIVRINDRGPFHGNREIDVSKRTAEMLDFKQDGIAKVRVEYVGRARLDGKDDEFLMASYRGPGSVVPGGTRPGTMLASAESLREDAVAETAPPPPAERPVVLASYGASPAPIPASVGGPAEKATAVAPSDVPGFAGEIGSGLDEEMLGFSGYGREQAADGGFALKAVFSQRGTSVAPGPSGGPAVVPGASGGPVPPIDLPNTGIVTLVPSYAPESRITKAFVAIGHLFR